MISLMTAEDEFSGCALVYFSFCVCLRSVKRSRSAFFHVLQLFRSPVRSRAVQRVGLCAALSEAAGAQKTLGEAECSCKNTLGGAFENLPLLSCLEDFMQN